MISIIIPTLNEEAALPPLLDRLAREPARHEVVVVDGGSRDGTVRAALASGARIVQSPPGRGQQLAAGGQAAAGEILLFLHADSKFPQGGLEQIERALEDAGAIGGNFRLVFDGLDKFSLWLNGFYASIRRRGIYYGDSGIFVRREVYEALGGIRPIALMEDYEFVRRLESAGATVCIDNPPLGTSSRRFKGRHPLAIVAGWLIIHALFFLGMPADRLAVLYDSTRRRNKHA